MGVKYSRGPLPAKIRKKMGSISMVKVRALMAKFQRRRNKEISLMKRDELFMNREEVQWLFDLTSMQTFEMFRLMDKEHKFRISLWDMWGALILMCLDIDPDDKVDLIFGLGDHNNDEWMTIADLKTLMICVCRGLSRIKNIHTMTEGAIGKYIKSMLSTCHLKENGEISLRDIRNYMGMDENSRSYFAALGAKAAVVDTGMLVAQRREIMQEMAEVEKDIKEVMLKSKISQDDREAYEKERGGDIHVLHIAGHNADAHAVEGEDDDGEEDDGWGEPSLEQRARRLQRAKEMGSNETQFLQDALIFSDPNYAKKNKSDGGSAFDEHAILRKWKSLTDSEDGLRELDIDLLEDLFEHAGITLTDLEAEECLDLIPRNALNMFNVHDIIGWYRDKMNTKPPITGRPPLWRSTATEAVELARRTLAYPSHVVEVLNRQKDITDAIAKKQQVVREMEEAMREEQERLAEEARVKAGGKPQAEDGTGDKDKKKATAPPPQRDDIVGELKGYVRLAAWHRQSLQTPDPNKAEFKLKFGNPDEVKEEKPEPGVLDKLKKMTKKGGKLKAKKAVNVSTGPSYKTVIGFNYLLAQAPQGDRPLFYDKDSATLKHRRGWNALALLDVFKKAPVLEDENATGAHVPFGSVAWFGLTIGDGVDAKEELILSRAVVNFFEAVPLEYRAGIYTNVQSKIFNLPLEEKEVDSSDDEGGGGGGGNGDGDEEGGGAKKKHVRMLVVALLHETDYFAEFEESMPAGVAATRALRRMGGRLSFINSLSELYDASLPFESYQDRLFGPQEDELGDEGMNPLRFAKLQKARVKAARDGARKVENMSPEMVDEQLALRGLSILGQKRERKKRLKKAFERQAEISGFGELSAFGADMSNALFSKFRVSKNFGDRMMQAEAKLKAKAESSPQKKDSKADKNKKGGGMFAKIAAAKSSKAEGKSAKEEEEEQQDTPGMTLWDFNNFLSSTGAATLYDFREYKSAMTELGFLQDKNFGLTPEGLAAYYEMYGGIGRDMKHTGIGSMSDILKGELLASCHYDAAGLDGITAMLEKHAVIYPSLKYLLAFVGSVTDFEHEASYDSLADLLTFAHVEGLQGLRDKVSTPGWFSAFVHSCMEWLADGNDGVLVSLRRSVHDVFGRYSQYEELYPEIVTASAGDYAAARAASADTGADVPVGEGGEEEKDKDKSGSSEEKDAAPKKKAKKGGGDPAQAEEEAKERERELFNVRLDDQLPPRSDGCLKEVSTAHLQKLVKLRMTLSDILTDFDNWPLSRDDRESLSDLRKQTDESIADSREKIEQAKQLACAHALAAYDAIRLYTDGLGTAGVGTKDVSFHAHATGVDLMKFLPKGQGEPSVPRAEKEAKIQRAAARKSAALAAIERERLRRDENSEENAERRAAKAAEVAKKRIAEENLLFSDAQEGLLASRFGGKTPAEVAVVARMWEKLASTCQQRYPGTFKAFIHSNNCACAISELYGPDHFKAKEAIRQLDNAKDFVLESLEKYSNLTFPKSKDPIGKAKLEARLMEEEALRRIFVDVGPAVEEGGVGKVEKEKLDSDDSEEEGEEQGEDGASSKRSGSRRSSTKSDDNEEVRRETDEVLKVPEDLLVQTFCILQNYLALLRDAGNSYLLGKGDRVRKVAVGISKRLEATDKDSILERAAPPDYGECNVLLMPSFPEQAGKTAEEVQELYDALAKNEDEDSDSDSEGDYDDAEEGDTITAGGSSTSSLTLQSLPDSKRFKRRSSLAKFDPSLLAGGVENMGAATKEAAEAARRAEELEEAAIKAEREAKRLKYERQRRLDGILRKKVVKQRMKLYHLIDSGKINRVFDMKAGHVLSDNAKVNWGHHDDEEGDPTQFLEDSTQATDTDSDTASISSKGTSIASDAKRKKKRKKKKKKEQEQEEADMMAAKEKEKGGVDEEAAQNARLAERNSRKSTLFSMFSSGPP